LEIAAYEKTCDLDGIARQAHMLVSTAGNLGAMQTSALAREVEHFCKAGNPVGLAPLLDRLRHTCGQSAIALRAWQDSRQGAVLASA
jgi:HPt (histidine-containing phosphotransfer) domain-containing protein